MATRDTPRGVFFRDYDMCNIFRSWAPSNLDQCQSQELNKNCVHPRDCDIIDDASSALVAAGAPRRWSISFARLS